MFVSKHFVLPLIVFAFLPVTVQADRVDDYLIARMAKNHIPGLSVAIIKDGKVIKLKGYGTANMEWDLPVSPDTAFQLASSTKPLTGTALMLLVEDGRISLDDHVTKYLPDAPTSWTDITIRHLAAHTSGIKDESGSNAARTVDEAVKAAYKRPLAYRPGEKATYGLTDFIVLTRIIEKVTGQDFPVFLAQRVLDPLRMGSTRFDHAIDKDHIRISEPLKHRATVYSWDDQRQKIFGFLYGEWTYSAGGIYSTADDLARFFVALDTGKLLKQSSLNEMWSTQTFPDGTKNSFGVGWVIGTYNGHRTVGHSGGPALSDILRFPEEKLTIVVLTNQHLLYPNLAQGVADFFVPQPPVEEVKGIEDRDPETTARLKKLLVDAANGKVDAELFTAEQQANFVPAFKEFGVVYLESLDSIKSFVLIEEKKKDGGLIRRYRAIFGSKPVNWTFELTSDGKIASMEPSTQ